MPLISAVVDPYNHEQFVEQALLSVIEQGLSPSELEIVVVDDGSTDRTAEIVRKFESRVRLIRKTNGGQASALNAGIAAAHGEILCFLDGDDWWAKGKVSAIAQAFAANAEISAVGHAYYEVLQTEPAAIIAPPGACRLDLSSVDAARVASRGISLLGSSRLSVRRAVLNRLGAIPEGLVFCADIPIIATALALGGALILDEPLGYYRIHALNASVHDRKDLARVRRTIEVTEVFLKWVPEKLAEFGIPLEVGRTLLDPIRIELERTRLRAGEGGRRQVFQAERDRFRVHYQNPSLGYQAFQAFVSACALLLPPRRFYQMLDWYSRNNLKRVRSLFGKADPAVSPTFFERRSAQTKER